jgi:hypothetical protein
MVITEVAPTEKPAKPDKSKTAKRIQELLQDRLKAEQERDEALDENKRLRTECQLARARLAELILRRGKA